MFCNEHGTVDYCPECVRDELDRELESKSAQIASLEARVKELELAIDISGSYKDSAVLSRALFGDKEND